MRKILTSLCLMLTFTCLIATADLAAARVIVVGCEPAADAYARWEMLMLKEVSREAGLIVEVREAPWRELLPGLQSGEWDVVVSAVEITPERNKNFLFTDAYASCGQVRVVRNVEEQPDELPEGTSVAVRRGTPGVYAASRLRGIKVRSYRTMNGAFAALEKGRVQTVVCDRRTAINRVAASDGTLAITGKPLTGGACAMVLKRDSQELCQQLNQGIHAVRAKGIDEALLRNVLNYKSNRGGES